MRTRGRALLLFLAVLLACVGCDQAVKQVAIGVLAGSGGVSLAADSVRFELVSNPGGFLSLGAGLPASVRRAVFLGVVPLVVLLLCAQCLRPAAASPRVLLALGLVAGGGLGNWLDRLLRDGGVIDFVSIGLGPLRTGVFNVADVAVMAGAAILLLASFRRELHEEAG
jgi:signal peptidase II